MYTTNFQTRVVSSDDLEAYTSLRVGNVKAKVRLQRVAKPRDKWYPD